MDLATAIYQETKAFPRNELYGLTDQMRRAATSIACNIAEGSGRRTGADFAHFLHMAAGSLRELETLILLAHRLGYLEGVGSLLDLSERVGKMNTKLRQAVAGRQPAKR